MFSLNLRNAVARFRGGGRSGHARSFSSIPNKEWEEAKEPIEPARLLLLRCIAMAGGALLGYFTFDLDESKAANEMVRE